MRSVLLAMSLAAVACGSSPPTTKSAASPNAGEVCTQEKVTGTNMTRTVCRSEEAAQDERNAARNWYSAPRPTPTMTK